MVARWSRLASPFLAWVFLAAVVVQVFLAGLALFVEAQGWGLHVEVGWIIHLAPILVLIVVALSRPPRAILWVAVALAVVTFIQPILATLRRDVPVAAALHPVVALLIFSLALTLALQVTARARAARAEATPPASPLAP